jgi:hypothetical protein
LRIGEQLRNRIDRLVDEFFGHLRFDRQFECDRSGNKNSGCFRDGDDEFDLRRDQLTGGHPEFDRCRFNGSLKSEYPIRAQARRV